MAQSLHILVYKEPLLTYLLVSVPSIFTLRIPKVTPIGRVKYPSYPFIFGH